jgi:hypothetical protein
MATRRREAASQLRVFDASLWLGEPQGFPLAHETDMHGLKKVMAEYGITGGLVSHWGGRTGGVPESNRALLAGGNGWMGKELRVVLTGQPILASESGPVPGVSEPPEWVRGVRVFPKTHGFPLNEKAMESLGRWMIERSLVLFIQHTELDWPAAYGLARRLPELAIVVESQTRKIIYAMSELSGLLIECRNTFVEISNLTGPGFEVVLGRVGAERLIFGSFLPVNDLLVPMGIILDAEMSEADRLLIAGGNLRRLIGLGGLSVGSGA